jgi:hypothetical protein
VKILTNGQRGDLIDALEIAVRDRQSLINLLVRRQSNWDARDKANFAEWDAQRKRFWKLRRAYLAEEKRA